ncbi:MAG: M48 family metalloprotease [Rhodopseudomonas sp.]|nr:M48 family metalloprotease [Rhodopseudomonas sp.]
MRWGRRSGETIQTVAWQRHRAGAWIASAIATLLAGCAAPTSQLPDLPTADVAAELRRQQVAQIQKYYGELHRVDSVAFRIRTANVEFCRGWVSAQIGLYAATPRSLPRKYRSFSSEALNLSWTRPTAISVVEGSPAAKAGIASGDQVIALNDELIPVTGTAGWMGGWLRQNGVTPVKINIRHNDVDRTVTVTPVMGCAIPIDYVTADTANAFTTDKKIVVYSGIVELAKTDAELAVLIGHELAHSNLGHLDKGRWNAMLGWASGLAVDAGILAGGMSTGGAFRRAFEKAGASAFSVGFEREADYVGAYYTARAGYDLTGTENLWRALGQTDPNSIQIAKTHPITPVRVVQIEKVAAEIADKKRHHLPLVPDLKVLQAQNQAAAESDSPRTASEHF